LGRYFYKTAMLLRSRIHIEPYLPSPAKRPPSGDGWIHEIKHDGFRIMARRDSAGVRLRTRNGYDFGHRFPVAAAAIAALPAHSFLIDGEMIMRTALRYSTSFVAADTIKMKSWWRSI
jgi:bifunctional non-homologous end joining protein LigD